MNLFLIMDFSLPHWQSISNPQKALSNIMTFINSFVRSRTDNKILIIYNMKICFDTSKSPLSSLDLKTFQLESKNETQLSSDFGYTLWLARNIKSRILIFHLGYEGNYFNMVKAIAVAQRMKIRVDIVSFKDVPLLHQLAVLTNGFYHNKEEGLMEFLLKLQGTSHKPTEDKYYSETYCTCHSNRILYGLLCPVCLAIYCKFIPVCKRCKSKFAFEK
ncbi:General transcription factor IIH subunit 3 [Astathelohania contejeani]|uniref:General transcription and DNA repair factor IIH subunit TFB4 n=1 Tax=Astathelohania contejeani TaxID=164912 RepID=A0ABQ7I1I5_9MICR|nr:General transcription factor IIH subunit 3 [Thelohania contejeani]